MSKILTFGSMNYDYVYNVPHIVQPGETLASEQMSIFLGGKGFNQSIAAVRAGAGVWHAGQIGEDGGQFVAACRENGINTDYIKTVPGKTGHTIIQVDPSAENCILLYGGANQKIATNFVHSVIKRFGAGDWLLLQNETSCLRDMIDTAYDQGMIIVLNPSPYREDILTHDLSKISWFLINEVEGQQLTGQTDPDAILNIMHERFPHAGTVLTLGADGAVCQTKQERIAQKAFPVDAVDTTAAGDCFTGFFVSALCQDLSLQQAMEIAAKAAAICASRMGASPSIPSLAEAQAFGT